MIIHHQDPGNYNDPVCISDQVLQSRVHDESATIPQPPQTTLSLSLAFIFPTHTAALRNWSNLQTNQFESYNVL